ncbi:hypothetical protein SNE40_015475 [Patella caerulea]|uniref:BHLH domain-containing protein n=1 Tax=Patella caerulea TaxID=87958 RepID=A0AAN8PEV1_PATCE
MSDESSLSFCEETDIAKKNGNPTGSDESCVMSSPDQDHSFGRNYKKEMAPGKIRGRRGKAKKVLSPEDLDSKRLLANSQERDRMDKLNSALETLRAHLPESSMLHNRRLSKIKTLTVARNYIASLSEMIYQHDAAMGFVPRTSSCLYEPQEDVNNYYTPNAKDPAVDSRVPGYHSYDVLREQCYSESPIYQPFMYQHSGHVTPSLKDMYQYQSPEQLGYYPHSLAGAIRSDIMARPISEMTSLDFYSSTPLSSRTNPYSRR